MDDVGTQVPCTDTGAGVTLIVPTATRLCPPGSAHAHRPLSRYPRPAKRILASHSASKSGDLQRVLNTSRMAIGYVIVPDALVLHPFFVRCKIALRRAGDTLYEVCGPRCARHGDRPDRPRAAGFTRICSRTQGPRLLCRVPDDCSERSCDGGRMLVVFPPARRGPLCAPLAGGHSRADGRAVCCRAVRRVTGRRGGASGAGVAARSADNSRDGLVLGAARRPSLRVWWAQLCDTPSASAVTASRAVLIGIPSSEVPGVTGGGGPRFPDGVVTCRSSFAHRNPTRQSFNEK